MTPGLNRALVLVCFVFAAGCGAEEAVTMQTPTLDEITPAQWERLAAERIFFGHQSVGGNVIDGVRDVLAERTSIPIRVVETADVAQMSGPGLYHAPIGRNGEPSTKLAAFRDIAVQAVGDSGIALMKYCYVDVTHGTDPVALFNEYRETVAALKAKHPNLRIVHVTLPLLTDPGTVRHVAAVVRKLPTSRELNYIRHQYNELLRKEYAGKDPIFDLARYESSKADGSAEAVRYRGNSVPVLAKEWTYDGGHLNEVGRRRVAEAFLAQLADAYGRGASAP